MSQRTAFLLQVLEKIGAPLMAAVAEISGRATPESGSEASSASREAERLATLLTKSVQVGVGLSTAIDSRDPAGREDSVRLTLTGLAAGLVSGQYRNTGKIPEDAEIKRLVTALEAVLTFADHFTPAPANTAGLASIDPLAADSAQSEIRYMACFIPVIVAVTGFSFGRQERLLLQEIAARLVEKSDVLKTSLGMKEDNAGAQSLPLLASLARLYAQCHEEETRRIAAPETTAGPSDSARSLERIWGDFDRRAGMLEFLARQIVPGNTGKAESGTVAPPPVLAAVPVAPVMAQESPERKRAENPMGFFKPKKEDATA